MLDDLHTRHEVKSNGPGMALPTSHDLISEHEAVETLVANSSIQIIDLELTEAEAVGTACRYFECRDGIADGEPPSLHQVSLDADGVFHHPLTNAVGDPALTYAVDGRKALDAFAEQWIPLPFMRCRLGRRQTVQLEEGPSNWVRLYIHKDGHDPNGARYQLVLAIDTALEPTVGEASPQHAPSLADAEVETMFRFSSDVNDIGWFVTEPWVDEWLAEAFRENRTRHAREIAQSEGAAASVLDHLAHYLTLLEVLDGSGVLPAIRLRSPLASSNAGPVPVDLVLDVGSSRTFALLAEDDAGQDRQPRIDILPVRDLGRPWQVHTGVFSSRMEFARVIFGKEVYSRWSGRTNAFYWPSIARVGSEAQRLASEQNAADAFTGISSPIRYLWDDKASRHVWRFAGASGGSRRNALISGPLLALVTESGDVQAPGARGTPTTKPRFSRSSLCAFLVAEIIQHALVAINSPAYRWSGGRDGEPRRLARIVITVSASMQTAERRILRNRVEAAIDLVWQAMGWTGSAASVPPAPPEIVISGDVASNTQLAFLANEIAHKFQGNARSYFELIGRMRSGHGTGRSVRVATLDVGGGTSSLAITTFGHADTTSLQAVQQVREGFAIGGDNVLKALVEAFVLPAIERQLADSKLAEPRQFLQSIVQGAPHGRSSRLGEFRRRLAGEIARPAAIAILKEHEVLRATFDDRPAVRTLGDLLSGAGADPRSAVDELESLASDEGADGFHCLDAQISFTLGEVAAIIRRALSPVVGGAVRAIRALDCDIVLISGWLSRLPVFKEILLDGMPIRPDRIIAMHEYRMGEWFPSRSALGSVEDPKSLPAVGAILASRDVVQLSGLTLTVRKPSAASDRCIMGRFDDAGFIPESYVVYDSERSAAGTRTVGAGRQTTLSIEPPTVIGMRRSPLANWPALPLYALTFEEIARDAPPKLPVRVTLEWKPGENAGDVVPWIARATDADGIELASTEIGIRLQTLASPDGHWLDTGVFDIA